MELFRLEREQNRRLWDELTPVHFEHPDYHVAGFLDGKSQFSGLVKSELGDIKNKKLLHLMCHFGLDALSLARMGAEVTGVDFSGESIKFARRLAAISGLQAQFHESDVYDFPLQCQDKFDIVFSSLGVLTWLPDLILWAEIISYYLKPDGFFYLAEIHPLCAIFNEKLEMANPYFHREEPMVYSGEKDYCDPDYIPENKSYEWRWSVADVVTALCLAGLKIEFLHEFPFALYRQFDRLEERDGYWWPPHKENIIPLTFSIRARK